MPALSAAQLPRGQGRAPTCTRLCLARRRFNLIHANSWLVTKSIPNGTARALPASVYVRGRARSRCKPPDPTKDAPPPRTGALPRVSKLCRSCLADESSQRAGGFQQRRPTHCASGPRSAACPSPRPRHGCHLPPPGPGLTPAVPPARHEPHGANRPIRKRKERSPERQAERGERSPGPRASARRSSRGSATQDRKQKTLTEAKGRGSQRQPPRRGFNGHW